MAVTQLIEELYNQKGSRVAEGAKPADILGGEGRRLAAAIGDALRTGILVPDFPRLTAAFGAACPARGKQTAKSGGQNA